MKSYLAIAALLLSCSIQVNADEKSPGVGTIGTGTFSCEKFAKYDASANNSAQMALVIQWTWGFISAYNVRAAFAATYQEVDAPNPVRPPDAASMLTFIRAHCEKNPTSNVADATLALIGSLGGVVTSVVRMPQT
jgi:hypothetical protein